MSVDSYIGEAPRVPSLPELLAQMHALDVQIQQTDREIAARPYPSHPQGPKESAEWAELQTWWVNNHWRPFVAQWDRGMKEIREYEAGTRGQGQAPLIELLTWLGRMGDHYRSLRQSAGASFYITVSTPQVGLSFGDVGDAFESAAKAVEGAAKGTVRAVKGAAQKAVAFVKHPPGWFATIFPLMTMENQRYWAGKLGGSTGEQLYDAGVKAVAAKYLGPQGPALVEAYNKVTEDAAQGNLNAKELLAKAPEIAKLAAASNQGPDAFRAAVADTKSAVKVSGDQGEEDMTYHVGAEGQSYPEVASRAVQSVHGQNRSPLYGYLRSGSSQKIYLFPRLEDASAWFGQLSPEYDYAAVFSASNLRSPIAGMERFGRSENVSGDQVGNWWPFLLGLPLGGLGGYFLRRWQEQNPGRALPLVPPGKLPAPQIPPTAVPPPPSQTSGDPWLTQHQLVGQYEGIAEGYADGYGYSVGCPSWVGQDEGYDDYDDDQGYSVGCPSWVGATDDVARRREWPQTKALINSAIAEVRQADVNYPAAAYVWKLDAPSTAPYEGRAEGSFVMSTGTTSVVPFSSQAEALNYLREVAQQRPVALAMFERSSRHWPNPVAWRKSDQPEDAQVIAQHVASQTPTQSSGAYVGADTAVNDAVNEVRQRAQQLAEKREGTVIGVIHTSKDNLWHTLRFGSPDDADDWLNSATQDQNAYTYAAYFDKNGDSWPNPYIEKIGGFRQPKAPQRFRRTGIVGADTGLDVFRSRAKQIATEQRGNAVGVILMADRSWRHYAFNSLDDSIDWLQAASHDKGNFTYAAAFDKDRDGVAYFQAEEIGGRREPARPGEPIRREIATTSGEWMP